MYRMQSFFFLILNYQNSSIKVIISDFICYQKMKKSFLRMKSKNIFVVSVQMVDKKSEAGSLLYLQLFLIYNLE